jgi:hypothetical protein
VVDAFCGLLEPLEGGREDHERVVAEWLISEFALDAQAGSLLDLVRAEILVNEAPITEVLDAVGCAMRHQRWDIAFRGLERVRMGLGDQTPRDVFGLAGVCLHRLGQYQQADEWIDEGLGPQRDLLATPPVRTQDELLRRWGPFEVPVISIICNTYNHERYVDSAMRGFLSQDCAWPFEILVHDDASTDRTQDRIRHWQALYPHIVKPVLQTENQLSKGVRPFELLLARARGEFVACCEGDDYWVEPSKLSRQVGFLMDHPDVSCSAHNYYHLHEASLTARPWTRIGRNFFLTQRQVMGVHMLLWLPTLVFRRKFSVLPPERDAAAFGDQFLTSYLGTFGRCVYLETLMGAVRRENEFSLWSPLPNVEKEKRRVRTWAALVQLHERLGHREAVIDLMAKIEGSKLAAEDKAKILDATARQCVQSALAAA